MDHFVTPSGWTHSLLATRDLGLGDGEEGKYASTGVARGHLGINQSSHPL